MSTSSSSSSVPPSVASPPPPAAASASTTNNQKRTSPNVSSSPLVSSISNKEDVLAVYSDRVWRDKYQSTPPTSPHQHERNHFRGFQPNILSAKSASTEGADLNPHLSQAAPNKKPASSPAPRRGSPARISPSPTPSPPQQQQVLASMSGEVLAPPRGPSLNPSSSKKSVFVPLPSVIPPEVLVAPPPSQPPPLDLLTVLNQVTYAEVGDAGIEYLRQKLLELETQRKEEVDVATPTRQRSGSATSNSSSRHRKEDSRDSISNQMFETHQGAGSASAAVAAAQLWYEQRSSNGSAQSQGDGSSLSAMAEFASPQPLGRLAPHTKMFVSNKNQDSVNRSKPPSPMQLLAELPKENDIFKVMPGRGNAVSAFATPVVPQQASSTPTTGWSFGSRQPSAFKSVPKPQVVVAQQQPLHSSSEV